MSHLLTDAEWALLAPLLQALPVDQRARKAAQACLFRFNTQLARKYRSFGWNQLPAEFGIDGTTANRRFGGWTRNGDWFEFWDRLVALRFGEARPERPDRVALARGTPLQALGLELTRAYRYFNARFFGGELPASPVVTVEPSRANIRGYFKPSFWRLADGAVPGTVSPHDVVSTGASLGLPAPALDDALHHIAVLSTAVSDGIDQSMATLLHEMAHLRNASLGIRDTNPRFQYHTQDFRDVARLLGLECAERDLRHGFHRTSLGPRARAAIAVLKPVASVFDVKFS